MTEQSEINPSFFGPGVKQLVDLATPEGIYQALGVSPKFHIGDRVNYMQRGRLMLEVTITGLGVEYGAITYTNDAGKWGYEDQYAKVKA